MDLPTYTSIWRIEKRLYKLYDFRLPMPVPVGQIAVFAAITVPYVIILTVLGLPFSHTLFWLYVLPPGVLTWLATRPVLESKRLPELIISQVRYLGEPATWCRMSPLAEKDEVVVVGRVWRRAEQEPVPSAPPAPARRPVPVRARPAPAAAPAAARAAAAQVTARAAAPVVPPVARPGLAGRPGSARPAVPSRARLSRPVSRPGGRRFPAGRFPSLRPPGCPGRSHSGSRPRTSRLRRPLRGQVSRSPRRRQRRSPSRWPSPSRWLSPRRPLSPGQTARPARQATLARHVGPAGPAPPASRCRRSFPPPGPRHPRHLPGRAA